MEFFRVAFPHAPPTLNLLVVFACLHYCCTASLNNIDAEDTSNLAHDEFPSAFNLTQKCDSNIKLEFPNSSCFKCYCYKEKWSCYLSESECLKKSFVRRVHNNACRQGEIKQMGCNWCICRYPYWFCHSRQCQRIKRDIQLSQDLENIPCAPKDYFKIDCNICYCDIDNRGYLCTDHTCTFADHGPVNVTTALGHEVSGINVVPNPTTSIGYGNSYSFGDVDRRGSARSLTTNNTKTDNATIT